MAKTQRLAAFVVAWLWKRGRPATTRQVLDAFNSVGAYGSSMNQIVNVLAKNKHIRRLGVISVARETLSNAYKQRTWEFRACDGTEACERTCRD